MVSKLPQMLTPAQIVQELDKHIIGQAQAKRAVAIALRNRWRRLQVQDDLRDEISPMNILLIGSTGVGKTEIARRLAKLSRSPFLKVEASKFTEVGYVGRDVESMVRDLMEVGISLVHDEFAQNIRARARKDAEEEVAHAVAASRGESFDKMTQPEKEELLALLGSGALDDRYVEILITEKPDASFDLLGSMHNKEQESAFADFFNKIAPQRKITKKLLVAEAIRLIQQEKEDGFIDKDAVEREAVSRVEQMGIIFIDEIDKIAVSGNASRQPDISREGVQRDLLPIIEGSSVKTKYGFIKTDHILFIASGAFHVSKPSDLIPELQGRFPIRVTLDKLTKSDFVRILREPDNNLIRQYMALLKTEDVALEITDEAIEAMAEAASRANDKMQNIGARRLHTVIERVFSDIAFDADGSAPQTIHIDKNTVDAKLSDLVEDVDMGKYIL